ncbi:MAG: LamG-like jellyroll fold domain-containing protein [Planctomycetota bacterium]|jgi:hypothetical protein
MGIATRIPSYGEAMQVSLSNGRRCLYPNLWEGLRGLWLPFVGRQNDKLLDWGPYKNHATPGTTPGDWQKGPHGAMLNVDSGAANDLWTLGTKIALVEPWSFAWRFIQDVSGSDGGIAGDLATGTPDQLYANGGNNLLLDAGDGTNYTFTSVTVFTSWRTYCLVGTGTNGDVDLYIDGAWSEMQSAGADSAWDCNTLGDCYGTNRNYALDGKMDFFAAWDRALSPAEAKLVTARPSLMATLDTMSWLGGALAAAATVVILRRRRECA